MSDWHQSNVIVRTTAQRLRDSSHRIRQEGRWLRNESDNHTRWTQHDSDTRMEERLDDVTTWRKSLEKCLEDTDEEIRRLEEEKERCERALEAKKVPLDISLECLMLREQRIGIDLVRDPVEANLGKEVEVIEGCKALLQQKINEASEQLCLLQEARQQLYRDLTDKNISFDIDKECLKLNNTSPNICFHPAPTRTVKGSVTPETWDQYSNYNKLRAEAEIQASQRLREAIFATIQKTANDLEAQRQATEFSYRKRIHETEQTKSELEWQQRNTKQEIETLEGDILRIKQAIEAKKAPMMVAQTRLENRTYRPNVELCRDSTQYQLCHEVREIEGTVKALVEKLQEAQNAHNSLTDNLRHIEEDLSVKVNSLALDNRCMTSRQKLKETPQDMTRTELFNLIITDDAHLNFKTPTPMRSMVDAGTLERSVTGPLTVTKQTTINTLPASPLKSARVPLLTN